MLEEVKTASPPAPTAEPGSNNARGKRTARRTRNTKPATKTDAVIALLTRVKGATIDEMMKATGWQSHSVRGFLAGTVKKKLGRAVVSEKAGKGRIYRIASEAH